jgi:methyltransferase-like protein
MTEDIIEIEQYMDFLTNRGFRETLLCHQDVSLSRTLNPDYLATLRVASRAEPATPDLDVRSTEVEEFRGSDDTSLATAHPLTKTALRYLAQVWPQAVPFYTLLAAARSMLDPAAEAEPDAVTLAHDAHVLGTNLLQAYSQSISLIEFHTHVPHFVLEVSERPMASAAARYQAQNGLPVTNLYHQGVTMGEVPRHLLVYLDGSRDRTALLDVLVELAAQGILEVKQDDQPVEDVELVRRILEGELDTQLRQMAQAALLVG